MKQEARFLLAISLMLVVLVGTNILFAPPPPPELPADSVGAPTATAPDAGRAAGADDPRAGAGARGAGEAAAVPELPAVEPTEGPAGAGAEQAAVDVSPERFVVVEGPLYRYTFSTHGARATSIRLPRFESFAQPGAVELVADSSVG
ncbi:MAG: hypothetical protein D6701_04740, partial [Gemmatimonadetes bacterium]